MKWGVRLKDLSMLNLELAYQEIPDIDPVSVNILLAKA